MLDKRNARSFQETTDSYFKHKLEQEQKLKEKEEKFYKTIGAPLVWIQKHWYKLWPFFLAGSIIFWFLIINIELIPWALDGCKYPIYLYEYSDWCKASDTFVTIWFILCIIGFL